MSQRQRIEVKQSQRLKLSSGLLASIEILKADATGLNKLLEEQAAENPSLTLIQPATHDWLPRWSGIFPSPGRAGLPPADAAEQTAGPGPSLMAHVLAEIDRRMKSPLDRKIAVALAEALAPSGWIDRPLAAIARETQSRLAEVEAVLVRLQQIDPPGLFARNLTECLTLQAEDAGMLDKVMRVVLGNLDLLGRGETARLAQMAKVPEAEVQRTFRLIRTMNPKPGTTFDPIMAPTLREPDLLVRRRGSDHWQVSLNGSALPDIQIDKVGGAESWSAARALDRMVAARNSTLLRVGAEVLRRQRLALDGGASRLQPLTMAEVAAAVSMHESTVSRVVAGTSVDTPWGVWWLRKLFSRGVGRESGAADGEDTLSTAGLRDLLARKIAAEPTDSPLTDEALSQSLAIDLGVAVARRTVAKYRGMLGIPPAHRRKLRAP